MTDLRLTRLDDEAAAFIRQQAISRSVTPTVVVERMVRLTRALVRSADEAETVFSGAADGYLNDAELGRFLMYYDSAAPPAA